MGKPYEAAQNPGPLVEEGPLLPPASSIQQWRDRGRLQQGEEEGEEEVEVKKIAWESVNGLDEPQRNSLAKLSTRGVYWKHPSEAAASPVLFLLFHGGDVEADGNCLFTASQRANGGNGVNAEELRRRTVLRFVECYEAATPSERDEIDKSIKHLYAPDLDSGWGVHVVQDVKLLASKLDRPALDASIEELVQVGLQRETAAESIYKERCMAVEDWASWGKYMSISGGVNDEYDIITLQYTAEGLLTVDENREGRAAAFGDDIAIESLATEFKREIFVVQAHGSDAMIEDENCLFFLPHQPRGEISYPPIFLFMKGTGWCGAGADHYEPLLAYPAPVVSQEKAAFVL